MEPKINTEQTLPTRIENMAKFLDLLKQEKEAVISDDEEKIKEIKKAKRIIEIELEIISKEEFLKAMREKVKVDKKEFDLNVKKAYSGYNKIIASAESFLDQDEKDNEGIMSHKGNMVNYIMNELVTSHKAKDDTKVEFFYSALKKELDVQLQPVANAN